MQNVTLHVKQNLKINCKLEVILIDLLKFKIRDQDMITVG